MASRRDFLKSGTAAAAGLALAGGLNIARTAHAAGGDELKIALIGCGGRGTGAVGTASTAGANVKLIAVADAFADKAENCLTNLRKEPSTPPRSTCREERVFVGFDAYQKAHCRRRGHRSFGHAARFPPHPLRGGHRGGQARLHGEAVLHRRPRLPLVDGDQQAGRREGPESRGRPAAPPQQGLSAPRSRRFTTASWAT